MTDYNDREVFGGDEIGGFLSGVGKAIAGVGKSAVKAGGAAVKIPGLLVKGKVKKAGKQAATAVGKITSNPVLQATNFPLIVPNIAVAAARGGPKAAMAEAKKTAKNPMIKAEIAAAGLIFPPAAPISAGAIAGMEAASRVNDALKSKDPGKIAQAALTVAATGAMAAQGNPGAKRALSALNKVSGMKNLVTDLGKGIPAAQKAAKTIAAKGGNAKTLAQMVTAREALMGQKSSDPKVRARAAKTLTNIQKEAPGLLAGVQAALRVPEKVQLGRFAVLRTGRILLDGKPIQKAVGSLRASVRAR